MIYDLQRLRLLDIYRTLSKHTKILGVHTDGFHVESVPALMYHTGIKTINDFGKLQLEGEKMTPFMHYKCNTKVSVTKMPQLEVREPYAVVDEVESNTFIDGEIAGAGKTHVALQFLTDQSLIVIQSDKQIVAMEQRIKAQGLNAAVISYATLLGQIYEDNKLVKTKAPYNVSEHDHILLDELFQIPVQDYERIIIMLKGKSVG